MKPGRGKIEPAPTEVPAVETTNTASLISRGCQDYEGSQFSAVGRGGVPSTPLDPLGSRGVIELDWVEA